MVWRGKNLCREDLTKKGLKMVAPHLGQQRRDDLHRENNIDKYHKLKVSRFSDAK